MIASTPRASSQRASSTVVADESTFAPQAFTRCQQIRRRQTEVEAHHRRLNSLKHVGGVGAERRAPRPQGGAASIPNSA